MLTLKKDQVLKCKREMSFNGVTFNKNDLVFVEHVDEFKTVLSAFEYNKRGCLKKSISGHFPHTEFEVLNIKSMVEKPFDLISIKDYVEGRMGLEYQSYTATLMLKDEKIADLRDYGDGGGVVVDFVSGSAENSFSEILNDVLMLIRKLKDGGKIKDSFNVMEKLGFDAIENYFIGKHYLIETLEDYLINTDF